MLGYDIAACTPASYQRRSLQEGPKGWAVRPLKWHASWVQNVVRQFGLYLSWAHEICVALTLVREDRVGLTSGLPVVPPGALPGI